MVDRCLVDDLPITNRHVPVLKQGTNGPSFRIFSIIFASPKQPSSNGPGLLVVELSQAEIPSGNLIYGTSSFLLGKLANCKWPFQVAIFDDQRLTFSKYVPTAPDFFRLV